MLIYKCIKEKLMKSPFNEINANEKDEDLVEYKIETVNN